MIVEPVFTRRDRRYGVRAACSRIELNRPGGMWTGSVCELSVGGFSADFDSLDETIRDGVHLTDVVLTLVDCELRGEATVRFVKQSESGVRIGCVLFPADERSAERLMALLAGLESAET